jgi:hypothetical protein
MRRDNKKKEAEPFLAVSLFSCVQQLHAGRVCKKNGDPTGKA